MMDVVGRNNLGDIVGLVQHSGSAFHDSATNMSYSLPELDDQVARLCGALSQKYQRGSRLAILSENGAPFTLTYLAAMRAGLVPVPVNYRLPRPTINHIFRDAGCSAAFVQDKFTDLVPDGISTIGLETEEFRAMLSNDPEPAMMMEKGELCEILYTSGSTGLPKGVPLDHHGQLWALQRFADASGEGPVKTVIVAPAYHMNGLFFTTVALALGWHAWSMPRFDSRAMLQLIAEERITLVSGIPTMFAMMAREDDLLSSLDLSCVTDLVIGSAPLTDALIARVSRIFPNADIRNSYGTTESGPAMFGPHPDGLPRPSLALGYPYPDVELRLEGGDHLQGELWTRTPAVLKSYLNNPEAIQDRLEDGWYCTGDVVSRDANGFYYFVGRTDDMFVCGGENVYPGEVERLLESHPGVLQAAVIPVHDEVKGQIPIAFATRTPNSHATDAEIRAFSIENGPAYAHPRAVVWLDKMPIGGTHKIDKSALLDRAIEAAKLLRR